MNINIIDTLKVGDPVTHHMYSDSNAGWVSAVSRNGRQVEVELARAQLLNGPDSGAPDALKFSPGGFCGHMSGNQRWLLTRDEHPKKLVFTKRSNGRYRLRGAHYRGRGDELSAGHHHHYDFNF